MKRRPFSKISGFSAELVRRKVYPVVVAYAVVAWVLLQIGEVTFDPLGVPDWVMTALVVVAIVGFPVAAILAWMFDIAPGGIRRDTLGRSEPENDGMPSVAVIPVRRHESGQGPGLFL